MAMSPGCAWMQGFIQKLQQSLGSGGTKEIDGILEEHNAYGNTKN